MILTGKAKEDFTLWCENNSISYIEVLGIESYLSTLIIEWFDSVGVYISIKRFNTLLSANNWYFVISNEKGCYLNNYLEDRISTKSRQEVTKQAILKCNEIYNSSKN